MVDRMVGEDFVVACAYIYGAHFFRFIFLGTCNLLLHIVQHMYRTYISLYLWNCVNIIKAKYLDGNL